LILPFSLSPVKKTLFLGWSQKQKKSIKRKKKKKKVEKKKERWNKKKPPAGFFFFFSTPGMRSRKLSIENIKSLRAFPVFTFLMGWVFFLSLSFIKLFLYLPFFLENSLSKQKKRQR
jgi:hypothetical protein